MERKAGSDDEAQRRTTMPEPAETEANMPTCAGERGERVSG
jgi:hypothetical protein